MQAGYDPERIRALRHRTTASIEALDLVRSADPAAADALRSIRLTRQNLEDLWMPALLQIERSEAMVTWSRAHLASSWRHPKQPVAPVRSRAVARPLASADDDRLIDLILLLDRLLGSADGPALDELPPQFDADALARELALRVRTDANLADRLISLAPATLVVGHLVSRADFPTPFLADVVWAMAGPVSPRASSAVDRYAASMSAALSALVDQPATCLDLLTEPAVLFRLASWRRLDDDIVADFTMSGLFDAVNADPDRLIDGYRVMQQLTEFTNGPLDDSLTEGLALGFALSMPVYFDTLAPGVFQTGDKPVRVSELQFTIGEYDDVANLFGGVLRHDESAAALGLALGAFTDRQLADIGPDLLDPGSFRHVANLSVLLDDAAESEQAQLVMEAAAEEARRRSLGSLLNRGTTAVLTASGAGAVWRSTASAVITTATGAIAGVDAKRLAGASIGSQQYQQIWMSSMAVAFRHPQVRSAIAGDPRAQRQTRAFEQRLDEIEHADDPDERENLIVDLQTDIDGTPVGRFVADVMDAGELVPLR